MRTNAAELRANALAEPSSVAELRLETGISRITVLGGCSHGEQLADRGWKGHPVTARHHAHGARVSPSPPPAASAGALPRRCVPLPVGAPRWPVRVQTRVVCERSRGAFGRLLVCCSFRWRLAGPLARPALRGCNSTKHDESASRCGSRSRARLGSLAADATRDACAYTPMELTGMPGVARVLRQARGGAGVTLAIRCRPFPAAPAACQAHFPALPAARRTSASPHCLPRGSFPSCRRGAPKPRGRSQGVRVEHGVPVFRSRVATAAPGSLTEVSTLTAGSVLQVSRARSCSL